MTHPIITIDGPSGAGKGTIAYRLAEHFRFNLLDSGALYRIVGLLARQQGILTDDILKNSTTDSKFETQVAQLTQSLAIDFVIDQHDKAIKILINNNPLTDDIRNETVGAYASKIATLPSVRTALLGVQHQMATRTGLVADGRDMGTVIFPNADVKIFLTASSQARTDRRVKQLLNAGKPADYDKILAEINARDAQDQNRPIAPLKPADDAVIIDSSNLNADEVFLQCLELCQAKLHNIP